MRALLGLALVAGCSTTNGPVTFTVELGNVDPTVDAVRAYDETFPVVDQRGTVTMQFPTYADGVASGEALVELLRGQTVVKQGTIAVGACATCVYSSCPSLDSIDEEAVRYIASYDISPTSYDGFTCTGGDHSVHASK
jgi:hypothetical protein